MDGSSVFSILSSEKWSPPPNANEQQSASPPLPSPPPAIEVFPSHAVKAKLFSTETVNLQDGLALLKGRVNTVDIFGLGNTDLVPGKYEGGLKLWECSLDLVNTLRKEIKDGFLSFSGKRVLELGCGHGFPGIYACMEGASTVHFQDFNAEVLQGLTILNVKANLNQARPLLSPDTHFYAGDWGEIDKLLSVVSTDETETADTNENGASHSIISSSSQDINRKESEKSQSCEKGGYDIILMSETVYSLSSLHKLYTLIKKCLRPCSGVVYVAGKKYYFGVGGGTRGFKHLVEEDGILKAQLVADFADGFSNVREIWKFLFR